MRRFAFLLVLVASLFASNLAFADDKAAAKDAYARGAAEFKRGEYAQAATDFAAADALAPSPAALKMALDAAVEADAVGLGLELLERSKRAPATEPLASSIVAAKAKFEGRAVVREPAPATPEATSPAPAPPPPPPPSAESSSSRPELPPWIFWGGVGATGVAGVLTVAFGLDASGTHSDFESAGCTNGAGIYSNCVSIRDDGEAAATRTNVALVSTLVLGAATAVVGLLLTRWSTSEPPRSAATR